MLRMIPRRSQGGWTVIANSWIWSRIPLVSWGGSGLPGDPSEAGGRLANCSQDKTWELYWNLLRGSGDSAIWSR